MHHNPTLDSAAGGSIDHVWMREVEELFRTEFAPLCRLAQRLLSPSQAEEVVQEAFTKLAALQLRPAPGSERPYLRSMVLNEARSSLRRRQTVERHAHRWTPPFEPGPADAALASAAADALRSRVALLPERQRQVVTLRFWDCLSEREIADVLCVNVGTVKTHASRALAAMRGCRGADVA
jgi:RNA polymerase sigma factor (sigma-70 family)